MTELMTKTQYKRWLRRNKKLKESRLREKKDYKKIKRRIWWEVYYNDPEKTGKLTERYFLSANGAKKFISYLFRTYEVDKLSWEVVKVWCYREHCPRHKTRYYDFRPPNKLIKCKEDSY